MKRYARRTHLRAPLQAVADFHADTRALKQLSPLPVQIHRAEPIQNGSVAQFTMWMGPVPVRWTARHFDVRPGLGFSDEQIQGPFKRWVHRHSFEAIDRFSCVVGDDVQAEFGEGLYAGLLSRLMWIGLPFMFAYRAWILRRQHFTLKAEK